MAFKYQNIKSSNLDSAAFDGESKIRIKFKSGSTYEYDGVSPAVWERFQQTFETGESSGRYYRDFIKKDKFKKIK